MKILRVGGLECYPAQLRRGQPEFPHLRVQSLGFRRQLSGNSHNPYVDPPRNAARFGVHSAEG